MSGRFNQSASSLVFDIDVSSDFGSLGALQRGISESGSLDDADGFRSLAMERTSELSETSSTFEKQIKDDVQSIWPTKCIGGNGLPDVAILGKRLCEIGYQVQVVGDDQHKAKAGQGVWQQLPHSFLLCNGVLGPGDVTFCYQNVPVVIDPRFKEQFEIAHPSVWFGALLKMVPDVFVGMPDKLRCLVFLISDEMVKAFLEQKLSLPPWRNPRAMSSKWGGPISAYMKRRAALSRCKSPRSAILDDIRDF